VTNAIKSIVREHHWGPVTIDRLFLDEEDHHGLWYLYKDVEQMHRDADQNNNK
jgi:hypothetical protein